MFTRGPVNTWACHHHHHHHCSTTTVAPSLYHHHHHQGILTVTLLRARRLGGWTGEPDPFCTLALLDAVSIPGGKDCSGGGASGTNADAERTVLSSREEQRSSTVFNEDSPR